MDGGDVVGLRLRLNDELYAVASLERLSEAALFHKSRHCDEKAEVESELVFRSRAWRHAGLT